MKPCPPSSWMPRLVARERRRPSSRSRPGWPRSRRRAPSRSKEAAASRTTSRAPCTRAAAAARSKALPWWWATGLPNTTRSVVYSIVSSRAAWAIPDGDRRRPEAGPGPHRQRGAGREVPGAPLGGGAERHGHRAGGLEGQRQRRLGPAGDLEEAQRVDLADPDPAERGPGRRPVEPVGADLRVDDGEGALGLTVEAGAGHLVGQGAVGAGLQRPRPRRRAGRRRAARRRRRRPASRAGRPWPGSRPRPRRGGPAGRGRRGGSRPGRTSTSSGQRPAFSAVAHVAGQLPLPEALGAGAQLLHLRGQSEVAHGRTLGAMSRRCGELDGEVDDGPACTAVDGMADGGFSTARLGRMRERDGRPRRAGPDARPRDRARAARRGPRRGGRHARVRGPPAHATGHDLPDRLGHEADHRGRRR